MSEADKAKVRQKVARILAEIKRIQDTTTTASTKPGVQPETITRSTLEAYGFGAITIFLGVLQVTLWLKLALLLVLCLIAVDVCWRSFETANWRNRQKLVLIVVALSAIVAVSWHTVYLDWITHYSVPLNFVVNASSNKYESNKNVYGIRWQDGYEDIRLSVTNPEHHFAMEHLDLFVTFDGHAVDMKMISGHQANDVWIRPAPSLQLAGGSIGIDVDSMILRTDKGISIPTPTEMVSTNRYHIISSGRMYREDQLNFIVAAVKQFGVDYPKSATVSGSYEVIAGDSRIEKEITWQGTISR